MTDAAQIEGREMDVVLPGGVANVWRFAPPGAARLPAVLVLMDAPGLRPALHEIARRIAAEGYLVWLPNLYYRLGRDVTVGPTRGHPDADANRETMLGYIRTLGNRTVVDDVRALLDRLPADPLWNGGRVGITGYCMSGRFAVLGALAEPDRVACAASYFGTRLVTDEGDSPHLVLGDARAELYFAFAEHDSYVPAETVETLRRALAAGSVRATIETYSGTEHGFVFADRGSYHEEGARRHWASLLALLERNLRPPA